MILGRPAAPGLDFRGRNALIFERFRCPRARRAYFARSVRNTGRSCIFGTSELLRNHAKSTKNRSASAFATARRTKRARAALRGRPGASWSRLGVTFECFPAARGLPRRPQGRPRAGFWVSRSAPGPARTAPGHVPARHRNGFERPKPPKTRFSMILCRFFVDFGSPMRLSASISGVSGALFERTCDRRSANTA